MSNTTTTRPKRGARIRAAETDVDLLWGAESISRAISRNTRITFHLLESGQLPARKIGARWVISRRKLIEFFEGGEQ